MITAVSQAYRIPEHMLQITSAKVNPEAVAELFDVKSCRRCGNLMHPAQAVDEHGFDMTGWHCTECGALMFPRVPAMTSVSASQDSIEYFKRYPKMADALANALRRQIEEDKTDGRNDEGDQ